MPGVPQEPSYQRQPSAGTGWGLLASKSWFGHTEPEAGLVALVHVTKGAAHAMQPHLLHLRNMNPHCAHVLESMGEGKFSMGRQPAPRPSVRAAAGNSKANGTRGSSQQQQQQQQGAGVRTGTSSFAFMGTNAHVVSCVVQPNAAKASTPSAVASAQGGRMTTTQISTTGHQWRRKHLWAAPNPSLLARYASVGPSTPRSLSGAAGQGGMVVVMQAALSHPELSTLWDHQVKGQAILPGAAMLLMAQATITQLIASGQQQQQQQVHLVEASIPGPLVLPPLASGPGRMPTMCCSLDVSTGQLRVYSTAAGSTKEAPSMRQASTATSSKSRKVHHAHPLPSTHLAAQVATSAATPHGIPQLPQTGHMYGVMARVSAVAMLAGICRQAAAEAEEQGDSVHAGSQQPDSPYATRGSALAPHKSAAEDGDPLAAKSSACAWVCSERTPNHLSTSDSPSSSTGGLGPGVVDSFLQLGQVFLPTARLPIPDQHDGNQQQGNAGKSATFVPVGFDSAMLLTPEASGSLGRDGYEACVHPRPRPPQRAPERNSSVPPTFSSDYQMAVSSGKSGTASRILALCITGMQAKSFVDQDATSSGQAFKASQLSAADAAEKQAAKDVCYAVEWLVESCAGAARAEGHSFEAEALQPVLSILQTGSLPHTLPVATLLAAVQQCMSNGGPIDLQLLTSAMGADPGSPQAWVAALQGLLRTAAQEGFPASICNQQPDLSSGPALGAPAPAAPPACLIFGANSSASKGSKVADVYGSSVGAGGLQTVPRLVPCPAAHQSDGFAPYKLLPLPRGSLASLKPQRFSLAGPSDSAHSMHQVVSVRAVGLNFRDVLNVLGMYPGDPGDPGSDFAGVVESGPAFAPGTPVFGLATGCLASHVVSHGNTLAPLPPNLTFEEASSCPTILATVDAVLGCAAGMQRGEVLMLPAGAGGVGLAAMQVVRSLGGTAITTAGSPSKRALLRGLGGQHVSGSRDLAYVQDLAAAHPGGAHIVLNTLTSPGMVSSAAALLRAGGRFVEIGKRDVSSTLRMAQERPDVNYGFVALDFIPPAVLGALLGQVSSRLAAGTLRPIQTITHSMGSVSAALRQLSQARHVGKVVVGCGVAPSSPGMAGNSRSSGSSPLPPCGLLTQGQVAISGGLGSLGLLIAQWLAQQGVKHILLLARSARSTSTAFHHLSQLWQGPTQAVVAACDAGCVEDLCASLAPSSHQPPLSAVLHAGGVLADATLRNQSLAGLRKVMGAKVAGLPHLLSAAQLQPGAHHVLFSSVASLLGSPGQANYSAANAALDAAASCSESSGLPLRSIQWGPWKTGGMAAETAKKNEAAGIGALSPEQGVEALMAVLAASSTPLLSFPHLTAASPFDWHALIGQVQAAGRMASPLLALVAPETRAEKGKADGQLAGSQQQSRKPKKAKQQLQQGGSPAATGPSHEDIQSAVNSTVTRIVGSSVPPDAPLMSAGLDSLGAVELRNSLEGSLHMQLPGTLVFDYPSVAAITEFVFGSMGDPLATAKPASVEGTDSEDELFSDAELETGQDYDLHMASARLGKQIGKKEHGYAAAIVSASHRTPQAVLMHPHGAHDTISSVPEQRWDAELQLTSDMPARFGAWLLGSGTPGAAGLCSGNSDANPSASARGDAIHFDSAAFGMPASEAAMLDPQQRMLLEMAAEILMSPSSSLLEKHIPNCGVFVGISTPDYAEIKRAHTPIGVYSATGSALSVAAGRVSFVFGLHGPSAAIDTACSSSLVATHMALACFGPEGGKQKHGPEDRGANSNLALASGTKVILTPSLSAMFQRAGMLAPDGRCKTLDASADGYVRAEASAMMALARPSIAEAQGIPVLGLIANSSVNQDGRSSALTAPNGPAQQAVMKSALAGAGLQPNLVTGLQLHGTGTSLGDSIELGAAAAILRKGAPQAMANAPPSVSPLRVASDKSASGHTEPSAGLVGLLTALRATHEQATQPLLHLTNLNPHLVAVLESAGSMVLPRQRMGSALLSHPQPSSGVSPSTEPASLPATGISSFAFQGTNAHVLLQPPPHPSTPGPDGSPPFPAPSYFTPWAACQVYAKAQGASKRDNTVPQILWDRHYSSVVPPAHSVLRTLIANPRLPNTPSTSSTKGWVAFEAAITHPSLDWFRDHVVSGKALLPGAAFLELASAAGLILLTSPGPSIGAKGGSTTTTTATTSSHHLALLGVSLNAPLTIPESEAVPARQLLMLVQPSSGAFEIVSPPVSAKAASVQHVQGSMARIAATEAALPTLQAPAASQAGRGGSTPEAARARCTLPQDSTHLYSALRSVGLEYGPAFRLLDSVHTSAGKPAPSASPTASEAPEGAGFSPATPAATAAAGPGSATASITSHGTGNWRSCNFVAHPAALDCAFQLGAVVPARAGAQGSSPEKQVYVPAGVELFVLDGSQMGNLGHGQDRPTDGPLFASALDGTPLTPLPTGPTPNSKLRHISLSDATPAILGQGTAALGPLVSVRGLESRLLRSAAAGGGPVGGPHKGSTQKAGPGPVSGSQAGEQDVLYEVSWLADAPTQRSHLDLDPLPASPAAAGAAALQLHTSSARAFAAPSADLVSVVASALMTLTSALSMRAGVWLATAAASTKDHHLPAMDLPHVLAGAGLHALLRTLIQESGGSLRVLTQRACALKHSQSPTSQKHCAAQLSFTEGDVSGGLVQHDAYGTAEQMGSVFTPRMMRSLRCASADKPYKLLPLPRGSLASLQPSRFIMPAERSEDHAAYNSLQTVAVRAVGLNFRDVLNVLGMYPGDPGDPGGDCAGVVVDSGKGGSPYAPGTPVFGLAAGCLGSHVLCSHLSMARLPPQLSPEQAATCPTVFITADAVLRQAAQMQPGEVLLLPAAAGGVGLAALQVARALGATAMATAGSPSKRALLRSLGARHVSGSRDTAFVEDLAATSGGGVHAVLNTLTSPGMVSSAAALLRAGGRFVEIGKRDVTSVARLGQERPDVGYGFVAMDFMPGAVLQVAMQRLSQGLASGILRPLPLASYGLRSVAAALRQLSQARHVGKVVVSSAPSADATSQATGTGTMAATPSHSSIGLQPGMRAVITGGTGALGTLLAGWLTSSHWRCSVLLLGRTGKLSSPSAQQQVLGADAKGSSCASVAVAACDTTSAEELSCVLSVQHSGCMSGSFQHQPPVSLLFHAGGVLADATIGAQTPGGVRKVIAPKVATLAAAWDVLGSHPVAGATLFSSIASLLGAPGQANYSAANAAMDAAASTWQYAGMPTVSVQWGAWAGGGMAAGDASTAARVARMGMALLQPQQGLAALEGVLAALVCGVAAQAPPSPTLTANPFTWPTFISRLAKPNSPKTAAENPGGPFLAEMAAEVKQQQQQHQGQVQASEAPDVASLKPGIEATSQGGRPGRQQQQRWKEGEIEAGVMEAVAGVLGTSEVEKSAPLMESGLDSLGSVELRNTLSARFATELPATLTFDYPTPAAISDYIMSIAAPDAALEETPAPEAPIAGVVSAERQQAVSQATAITGMGIRFPHGMSSMERLLEVCSGGGGQGANELHSQAPFERFDAEAEYAPPGFKASVGSSSSGRVSSKFGAFVSSVHSFDAPAFSIPSTEAAVMDPQTRVLLEESAHAFIDSGRSSSDLLGSSVGIFVGCIWTEYGELLTAHQEHSSSTRGGGSSQVVTGNGLAFMAGRVSYTFGLTGPCVPTNTACSSSLVAAHLASHSLRSISQGSADCQAALAAGVNAVLVPRGASAAMTQVSALAPDGRCKAFAEDGDGYGRGEGFAAIMMEPLHSNTDNLQADGAPAQRVLAVYAGSAVNQDGRSSGLTAPNGPSQTALVKSALSRAGLEPGSSHKAGPGREGSAPGQQQLVIATHGTGTPLGDPMEVHALSAATSKLVGAGNQPMLVSLTANKVVVGHTEGCAGLAGLLSAHLATSTALSAPPLRLRGLNPHVASSMEPWAAWGGARLPLGPGPAASVSHAGTSSFGMSGVNAHAILCAPPPSNSLPKTGSHKSVASKPRWICVDMRRQAQLPIGHPLLPRVIFASPSASKLSPVKGEAVATVEFGVRLGGGPHDGFDPSCVPRLAWLWDHQVGGKALLPGAAYMEMAAAASARTLLPASTAASVTSKPGAQGQQQQQQHARTGVLGSGHGLQPGGHALAALEGGTFMSPCVMPPAGSKALWLNVQLNPVTGTMYIMSSTSSPDAGKQGPATTHFAASITSATTSAAPVPQPDQSSMPRSSSLSADALRARSSSPVNVSELYQGLNAAGLQYGPSFRLIRDSSCSRGDSVAPGVQSEGTTGKEMPMAQARLPITSQHTGMGYHLHPALLDSMLQLGATVPASGEGTASKQGGGAFVPASVGCLLLPASPLDVGAFSLVEGGGCAAAGSASGPSVAGAQMHAYAQQAQGSNSKASAAGATHRDHWAVLSASGAEGHGGDVGLCVVLRDLEAKRVGGPASGAQLAASKGGAELQGVEQVLYQTVWAAAEPVVVSEAMLTNPSAILSLCVERAGALCLDTSKRGQVVTAWALEVMQQIQAIASGAVVSLRQSGPSDQLQICRSPHMPDAGVGGLVRAVNAEQGLCNVLGSKDVLSPSMLQQGASCFEFSFSPGNARHDGYGMVQRGRVLLGPRLTRFTGPSPPPALATPHQYLPFPARGSLNSLKPMRVDLSPETVAAASAATGAELMTLEVHAVGLNFRDVLNVLGMYPGDPGAPGSDCAGVVVDNRVGSASGLSPGTPVFGLASGSIGSHVLCSPHTFAPLPPQLSAEQAATCPTVFITADAVLRQAAQMQPGEVLLLPAAAGGVGLAALQVAQALGATAIVTAGSPSKRALLRNVGARHVSGSRDTAFVEDLAATSGGGVHAVLNTLTSPGMVSSAAALLRAGGRFVEIGKRDVTSVARLGQERPDVGYGFLAMDFMPAAVLGGAMYRLSRGMASGVLRPIPLASHSLYNVAAALRQLSQARHVGKVVVSSRFGSTSNTFQNTGGAPDQTGTSLSSGDGAVGVIGGTGSLGVLVTSWLAGTGVRHIALLSRTGKASQATGQLWAPGHAAHRVQIILQQCDGSFMEDAAGTASGVQVAPGQPKAPLIALMHAGGVLQDATISGQSMQGLRKVLAPKVAGLPYLLGAAQLQPGAHHVLFSSVASLLGSPGQANYGAANAALDAAAGSWQNAGVPAISVQWGAWAGGGMAAGDAGTAARVARTGMALLEPRTGLAALAAALSCTSGAFAGAPPLLSAVPFLWQHLLPRFKGHPPPLLASMAEEEDVDVGTGLGKTQPAGRAATSGGAPTPEQIEAIVRETACGVLGRGDIGAEEPLMSAGLDSLGAVELRNSLEGSLQIQLPGTLVFDYPSVSAISQYITTTTGATAADHDTDALQIAAAEGLYQVPQGMPGSRQQAGSGIVAAVTGMCLRDARTGIYNRDAGVAIDAISQVPVGHWDVDALTAAAQKEGKPMPPRFGGWMSGAELFDAQMFGLHATEAVLMDPQQRLLLECAHEALTMAAGAVHGPTSVMVGIASAEYNSWVLRRSPMPTSAYSATGGALSVACGRISYLYGFQGMCSSVDTACSSSLVAAHLAMKSLQDGGASSSSSSSAVVGGTGLLLCPEPTAMFQAAGMLSPDGRCKTLDAAADGYVRAEACGALVLSATTKEEASAPGHKYMALIASSSVNQDGRSSALTAPNGPAQQAVMRAALASGNMHAQSITGLQLHGTGTPLGDPIEVGAAAAVLTPSTSQASASLPVLISAAKSVVGHTEAAAGVVGLCHTVFGLGSSLAQPLAHLHGVGSHLATALPSGSHAVMGLPRQQAGAAGHAAVKDGVGATGVSSFAFQGTNAHALLLPPTLAALANSPTQISDPASTAPSKAAHSLALAAPNVKPLPWQRHRVWATPPASVLLAEARFGAAAGGKPVTFVAQLGAQPSLACLWQNVLGGIAIAPTAFLLEFASAALATLLHNPLAITAAAAGPSAALADLLLSAPCVLPRQTAAAELLCVGGPAGQMEVRSPAPKATVHLRAQATASAPGTSGKMGMQGTAASAAMLMLAGLVATSCVSGDTTANHSSGTEIPGDATPTHASSPAGGEEGLPPTSCSSAAYSLGCVSASIDAANLAEHGGAGYSCIQDSGVDGRLVEALEFEGALQAGAIARHIQRQQDQGGAGSSNSGGVLSSMGAYLPPASIATAGHDGGRKRMKQVAACDVHTGQQLGGQRNTGGALHGVRVGMEGGNGVHRAEQVGFHVTSGPVVPSGAAEPEISEAGATSAAVAERTAEAAAAAGAGPHPLLALDAEARTAHLQERVLLEVAVIVGRTVEPEEQLMRAAGVDSLGAMELRSSLTNSVGCTLPTTLLYDHQSPAEIAAFISKTLEDEEAARLEAVGAKAKDSDTSNKVEAQDVRGGGDTAHTPSNLLKMLRPLPVPRPLFLAAPGVANAQSAYFSFSAFLQWSDQPIYVLDKDNDLDMTALAEANAKDVLAVQPPGNGPYILGGHSYGGAVAVEIALMLESWGHEVGLVLVMDTPRPEQIRTMQPDAQEPTDEDSLELMEMILGALGKDAVGLGASTGHPRESEEWKSMTMEQRYAFFAPVWRVMRNENVTVEQVAEQVRYVALTVKQGSQVSDMRHHNYAGRTLRGARMIYLRACIRGACDYVNDSRDGDYPHGVCWYDLCEELEVLDVPGDHFSILRQGKEDMALLVAALKRSLGAFGWTESVRREPRNLLLHASKARAIGASDDQEPGQGQRLDAYLAEMGVTDETRARLMGNMREYGAEPRDLPSPFEGAPASVLDGDEQQQDSDLGRASISTGARSSFSTSNSRERIAGGLQAANDAGRAYIAASADQVLSYQTPLLLVTCGGSLPEWACSSVLARPMLELRLPNRTEQLASMLSVQDLAPVLVASLEASQIAGPLAIGGIGYGAIVAHELACQVEDRGIQVAALVCCDSEKQAAARQMCRQPWIKVLHWLCAWRPDLDVDSFADHASSLTYQDQVTYIESLMPPAAEASAWRSAVQERLARVSTSSDAEVVHCWVSLHDLLLDIYESAFTDQPPPNLRAFLIQMYGAEEDPKAQMSIVTSYIKSIAPVQHHLSWEMQAATCVWRVSYYHSLVHAYMPQRSTKVPSVVALHNEDDILLGRMLPILDGPTVGVIAATTAESIDAFLRQHADVIHQQRTHQQRMQQEDAADDAARGDEVGSEGHPAFDAPLP